MAALRKLPKVELDHTDADGFRILGSLERVARQDSQDVVITCGNEGHPPADPHTQGHGMDVRTHDRTPDRKTFLLRSVLLDLAEGAFDAPGPLPTVSLENLATSRYFGQIEDPDGPNEHLHCQRRQAALPL